MSGFWLYRSSSLSRNVNLPYIPSVRSLRMRSGSSLIQIQIHHVLPRRLNQTLGSGACEWTLPGHLPQKSPAKCHTYNCSEIPHTPHMGLIRHKLRVYHSHILQNRPLYNVPDSPLISPISHSEMYFIHLSEMYLIHHSQMYPVHQSQMNPIHVHWYIHTCHSSCSNHKWQACTTVQRA